MGLSIKFSVGIIRRSKIDVVYEVTWMPFIYQKHIWWMWDSQCEPLWQGLCYATILEKKMLLGGGGEKRFQKQTGNLYPISATT